MTDKAEEYTKLSFPIKLGKQDFSWFSAGAYTESRECAKGRIWKKKMRFYFNQKSHEGGGGGEGPSFSLLCMPTMQACNLGEEGAEKVSHTFCV